MDNTSKNLDEMPKKSPLSFQIDLKKFEKATDVERSRGLGDVYKRQLM